jgi:hypothetical protein
MTTIISKLNSAAGLLAAGLLLLSAACGSNTSGTLDALAIAPTQATYPDEGLLPTLDALPEASHAVSMLGPGWYSVPILEQGVLLQATDAVTKTSDAIQFVEGDIAHYALFGISGFDGDSYPSSLQIEVGNGEGPYYVGVSRYETGRWEFAGPFTGEAQFEYPDVNEHSNPLLYVNGKGLHYIALVSETGAALQLTGMQLGVDGGSNAPLLPGFIEGYSGDSGISLYWPDSDSAGNPDFAGYALERADWPGTDYVEIRPVSLDTWYLDTGTIQMKKYRYRLRVEDFSGNLAHGLAFTTQQFMGDTPPVPLLDIPAGPLYGAQTVSFDMSASFDPDGDEITAYKLDFGNLGISGGLAVVDGPDSVVELLLQPGCYVIRCQVTANGTATENRWKLKVYPVWQSETLQVALPPENTWRMQRSRTIYYPQTDSMITIFEDPLVPGIGLSSNSETGKLDLYQIPYKEDNLDWISEPVIWRGCVYFAVHEGSTNYLACFDGSELTWIDGFYGGFGYEQVDLVVDGDDELRICYLDEFAPGDWRILAREASNLLGGLEIMSLSGTEGWFDVEWNEAANSYDMVYQDVGSLRYNRFDPVLGQIDSGLVGAGIYNFLDLEIDPATGTPGLVAKLGNAMRYHEYDASAMSYLPPDPIDTSATNGEFADLLFVDSVPQCFFGHTTKPAGHYRFNGLDWDKLELTWTPLSGEHCSMGAWPDGTLQVTDGSADFNTHVFSIIPDVGFGHPRLEAATSYQGTDLSAVSGMDGIHAYWIADGTGYHSLGDASARNWASALSAGDSVAIELMSDAGGNVFLSRTNGGASQLRSWGGAAWVLEGIHDPWGQHRPWMTAQRNAPGGQWWVHDDSVLPAQLRRLHDDDGLGLLPDAVELGSPRILEGAALWTGGGSTSIVIAEVPFGDDGLVGFLNRDTAEFNQVLNGYSPLGNVQLARGRQLDGANYQGSYGQRQEAFWAGLGNDSFGATRLTGANNNDSFSLEAVADFPVQSNGGSMSLLATVTACQAWGVTAVGLMDQFSGEFARLEWSNYGNFEELPLPLDMQHTGMHELLVGDDGRWHLLYRDIRNGRIYVISTT